MPIMHDVLSRFTPRGIDEFLKWIRDGADNTIPRELLEDVTFAERLSGNKPMPSALIDSHNRRSPLTPVTNLSSSSRK
jgi:hypothetical protein